MLLRRESLEPPISQLGRVTRKRRLRISRKRRSPKAFPRERADLTSIGCQVPPGPTNDQGAYSKRQRAEWSR